MKEYPLNKSFEVPGDWFLPDHSDLKISGTLYYTPEKTELQLNDAFTPLRGVINAGENKKAYPLVYGITKNGEAMTILRPQQLEVSINLGSGGWREPERLISTWLIIGAHIPADFGFSEVRFRVPGLQLWRSQPTIEHSIEVDQSTGISSPIYRVLPATKKTTPVPSLDATIEWGISWNSNTDLFTVISVGVSAWITIKSISPHVIEWYFEQQNKINTMLAFLAGTPMSPDCIEASLEDPRQQVSILVAMSNPSYCSYKNTFNFFMPCDSMGIDIDKVVAHWFEIYAKIQAPSQLALSILSSENLRLYIEFLSLMQSLEGFHRSLYNGSYMDEHEYKKVQDALGVAIPVGLTKDHKEALRSRIRYGNEFSLRKRLNELAEILSEPIRKIIFRGKGEIPKSWIDTRNYYTHWDENLRTNVLDGQELYFTNIRMKHFLRALYLDRMGIPHESIYRSLCNSSVISQELANLNALERRRVDSSDKSGAIMAIMRQEEKNDGNQEADTREIEPPLKD